LVSIKKSTVANLKN